MSKQAIIVVDIQNEYFAPAGKLPLQGVEDAAANAAKVIADARAKGGLVVYIRHEFPDPAAPVFTPGSEGVEIHSSVKPLENEQVILKHYPNSFRETELKSVLDANEITDVVVIGSMSHVCIDATCRAAADLGYNMTVVHDACATMDVEFGGTTSPAPHVHATIMAALAFGYGTVTTTGEYLQG